MFKKILLLLATVITIVLLAGIYKFNFTDDDIYIKNAEGIVVPIDEIKH
jgi:hypothetical protein